MSDDRDLWIFGYGSLVWRPSFEPLEQRAAWLPGFARRFWQGSTDHRGVPGAPGRVVTLVPDAAARCFGVAYRVGGADRARVLAALDHRERGGYERAVVRLRDARSGASIEGALVYRATEANPNYLGPAPLAQIAAQVVRSHGPSGPNREYVLRLAQALRALDGEDEHVFALEARVRAL